MKKSVDSSNKSQGCLIYLPWDPNYLGGVDVVVASLYDSLTSPNNNTRRVWIGTQDWRYQGERTDQTGRKILSINSPPPPERGVFLFLRYFFSLSMHLPKLLQQIHSRNIRTINCHYPTLNCFSFALLKSLGLWSGKLVLSFHGSDVKSINNRSLAWRLISAQSDIFVVCSGYLAEELKKTNIFGAEKIKIVYNGIDSERFRGEVADLGFELPRRYLINIGTFVKFKSQDVLIRVFAGLAQKFPDLNLVLVGSTDRGDWLAYLKSLTQDLRLSDRVLFLPDLPRTSVAHVLNRAELLVHTSQRETFSIVLLEAGCVGVPVLASRVGGIPEVVIDGVTGLLHDYHDELAVELQISLLLSNSKLAENYSRAMKERVSDVFSQLKFKKSYELILFG